MPYTCYTFLYDFCFMSLLLFVAHLSRCNIKFFQNHYVPTSILAGVLFYIICYYMYKNKTEEV